MGWQISLGGTCHRETTGLAYDKHRPQRREMSQMSRLSKTADVGQTGISVGPAKGRPGASSDRLGVPWRTVLPLAIVIAYVDGFWRTSLGGAVGAIERTQGPFASWLRGSTLVLPLFVLAVLGALTLALRWFGPVLKARTYAATALMVVAAATLVGIADLAANAVYNYHLQSTQLQVMHLTHHASSDGILALQQQATFAVQVQSVVYGAAILLVTNLVLVSLVLALRGGRLDVSVTRRRAASPPELANRSRAVDLRVLLAAGFIGNTVIHAAVVPQQLTGWAAAGVFFLVLAAAELAVAVLLLARPRPGVLLAAMVLSVGPLGLWAYSTTVGIPFGPGAGIPTRVGLADLAACALGVSTLLAAVVLLRGSGWLRRPRASAHLRSLTLVAVTAITAIGLTGSRLL